MTAHASHRIEFIGPSGIGKTTLYRQLIARLGETDSIIDPTTLTLRAALAIRGSKGASHAFDQAKLTLAPAPIRRDFRRKLEERLIPHADLAVASLDKIDTFLTICFQALAARDSEDFLRVRRANWLFARLRQASIADVLHRKEYVVFDELLCQSGFGIGMSEREHTTIWDAYYAAVPPPAIVIQLLASKKNVIRRLTERDGKQGRHLADIDASFECFEIAREALSRRGTRIVQIDSEGNPDENVDSILAGLRSIIARDT